MRRLNTRKRNKINLKNLNKQTIKIISILIVLLILFIFLYFYFFKNLVIKSNFEKDSIYLSGLNEETVFSFNKIIIFSSATANAEEVNNSVWNLNISQYSDICIYLNNIKNNDSARNTVKQLYIDNIHLSNTEYGTPFLYQKSIQEFGKCSFLEEHIYSDRIDFNIVSLDSPISYDIDNTIYNDLSSPITIGYYNQNVRENFLSSDSQVEYNGKLLKNASIPPRSILSNLSFSIHIINELDEEYICNINIEIPLETNNNSIYEDGYITQEIDNLENYKFLRIK